MDETAKASLRSADFEVANRLASGSEHYRAYVGPPTQYDFMGATQFALLFALGLREHHKLLDFGCGSLRAGRLVIPYLLPGHYHGVEPNRWLIDDAIERELGADFIRLKRPAFLNNADGCLDNFGTTFDFIVAQSIFSHGGTDFVSDRLRKFRDALNPDGIIVATFVLPHQHKKQEDLSASGWVYPGVVVYQSQTVLRLISEAGLIGRQIPWFHPRQTWFAMAHSPQYLPSQEADVSLLGKVVPRASI